MHHIVQVQGLCVYVMGIDSNDIMGLDITVHSCVSIEMTYDTGDSGGSIVCHMTPTHNCTLQKWIYCHCSVYGKLGLLLMTVMEVYITFHLTHTHNCTLPYRKTILSSRNYCTLL